jgi:hypothetical protein
MAMIDDFKAMFPEFSSSVVDQYWDSVSEFWCCYYGGSYGNKCDRGAILYLLAHLLQLRIMQVTSAGAEGADPDTGRGVASRSAGSVSESYFQTANDSAGRSSSFFATTAYGRQYLMLTSKNNGGVWV